MPKRRFSSSSSEDSEDASSASSTSSLTTQKEQLKYMFCNYIDFIFKNGKSKKKIVKALSQSFQVPPPVVLAAKPSSKNVLKRKHQIIVKPQTENNKRSRKGNLKSFFERKLSKPQKLIPDDSSSDSEDSQFSDLIPAKKPKLSSKSKSKPMKRDCKQNEGMDKINKGIPGEWRKGSSQNDVDRRNKRSEYCDENIFRRRKKRKSSTSSSSLTSFNSSPTSEVSRKIKKSVFLGESSKTKTGRGRILNIGSDGSDSENLIFLPSNGEKISKCSTELRSRSSSISSNFDITKRSKSPLEISDKIEMAPANVGAFILLSSSSGKPISSESQSNKPNNDSEEPSIDDTSVGIVSDRLSTSSVNKLVSDPAHEADVSCTSNDISASVNNRYGNNGIFDFSEPNPSAVLKNRSSAETPYSPKDISNIKIGNTGGITKTDLISTKFSTSNTLKSSNAFESDPHEVIFDLKKVKMMKVSESPKQQERVPSSLKPECSKKLLGSLKKRMKASSSSSSDSRSPKSRKNLKSPSRSCRSWSDSRSKSSSSGSKCRKDGKRKKMKNQLGLYSQKFSDSYESDSSYKKPRKTDFRDRDRRRWGDRSSQREGRSRQPVVKRIRNFLSLDSSVEEVFSNEEVRGKCQGRSDSDDSLSWPDKDDADSKNVPRRRRLSSSAHSSPWRLDLEKQRTHRHPQELTPGEDYSFKKRSHNMIKGGLRLHKTCSSSSGSSAKGARKTKEITISRTVKTTSSYEANRGLVPEVADSSSPEKLQDEPNAVRKVYMKQDVLIQNELGDHPRQVAHLEPAEKSSGEKTCEKKETNESRMDLTDSFSNDFVSVDSSFESSFQASHSKEDGKRNRVLMKPISESFQTKIDVVQNSNQNNQQELSTTPKTPLKISFIPKARTSNLIKVNRLAEASIKSAASKFNMHFTKKSDKRGSHLDHLFLDESGDQLNGASVKKSLNSDGQSLKNDLTSLGKSNIAEGLNPKSKDDKAAVVDHNFEKMNVVNREVSHESERFIPLVNVEETRTVMSSNVAKMSERSTGSKRGNARHLTISSHSSSIVRSNERDPRRSKSRDSSRRYRSSSYSRSHYSRSWSSYRSSSSRRGYRSSRRKSYHHNSSRSCSRRGYYYHSSSRSRRRSYSRRSSRSYRRRWSSYSYSKSPLHHDWRSYRRSRSSTRSNRSRYSSARDMFSRRRNASLDRYDVSSGSQPTSQSSRGKSSCSRLSSRSSHSSIHSVMEKRDVEEGEKEKPDKQDKEGHLIYKHGDILMDRYEILSTLGEGTFGKVLECKDLQKGRKLALKVIRNVKKYREAAEVEIEILEKLAENDRRNESLCIRLLSWFDYNGHTCLSFEVLGLSVYEFLKNNDYRPYPLEHVRHVGYQIVTAIKFLHDNKWTHTDLKPENILFVNSDFTSLAFHTQDGKQYKQYNMLKCTNIRLIDFGSATHDDERHTRIVSTRQYRAVEIILELGWHHSCDMWSIGCILFEMYTGNTLFQTHSNTEHLAMMEIILGPLPQKMCSKSRTKYFLDGKLDWDEETKDGRYVKKNCKPIKNYILVKDHDHSCLFELLLDLLTYEPDCRITSYEAVKDRFFHGHAGKL